MGRAVVAVIVGYLVIFAGVFVCFSVLYLVLDARGAFRPGTYEASGSWIATSLVLGLAAAVVGGWVCRLIAGSDSRAVTALAALLVVLGLLMAVPVLLQDEAPQLRAEEVGTMEAMQNARQPAWVALLNPFIGAAGVWLGGRPRRRAPVQETG